MGKVDTYSAGRSGGDDTYESVDIGLIEEEETEYGEILYRASFKRCEEDYVNYVTVMYVLLSIVCILFYLIGIIMILLTPLVRYRARKGIQNRRLYITSENVVYKQCEPAFFPCLGNNISEKHILLPLVTDVVLDQGWVQAKFNLQGVGIENAGQGGTQPGADVKIVGIDDPKMFKKLLLTAAGCKRNGKSFTRMDVEDWERAGVSTPFSSFATESVSPTSAAATEALQAQMADMNGTLGRIETLLAMYLRQNAQGGQGQVLPDSLPVYNAAPTHIESPLVQKEGLER